MAGYGSEKTMSYLVEIEVQLDTPRMQSENPATIHIEHYRKVWCILFTLLVTESEF